MKHAPFYVFALVFVCLILWGAYYDQWREAKHLRASLDTICTAKIIAPPADLARIRAACMER